MKRFIGILMCALMLFCPFLKAQAADTCPIEQIGADVRQNGELYNLFYNDYVFYNLDYFSTAFLKYTKGAVVHKTEEADAGLRYILDNGFPNKRSDEEYMIITQNAIINYMIKMGYINIKSIYSSWYENLLKQLSKVDDYQNLYDENCTNGKWDVHCEKIKLELDLYDELFIKPIEIQKEYEKNYTNEIILNGDSELKKSEDGKYYETGLLNVKRSDVSEYSVELTKVPEGALVIDKNGNEKTKFNINDEFKIKVPVDKVNSNQINIKINIDDTFNTYYIYKSQHYPTAMSYKKMPLDDGFINVIYSKPYSKNIKESKEFYLDIKADSIVSVPPTAAYIPLIILSVGLLAIILSFTVIMKKVRN